MSYRGWGKAEGYREKPWETLLSRKTGGIQGGGSELTAFASELIERFA